MEPLTTPPKVEKKAEIGSIASVSKQDKESLLTS